MGEMIKSIVTYVLFWSAIGLNFLKSLQNLSLSLLLCTVVSSRNWRSWFFTIPCLLQLSILSLPFPKPCSTILLPKHAQCPSNCPVDCACKIRPLRTCKIPPPNETTCLPLVTTLGDGTLVTEQSMTRLCNW